MGRLLLSLTLAGLAVMIGFLWLGAEISEPTVEQAVTPRPPIVVEPKADLPKEPAKQDLRDAGNGVVAPLRPKSTVVERLPDKPLSEPDKPQQARTLRLVRPIVELTDRLTNGSDTVALAQIKTPALDLKCGKLDRPCGRQARTALRQLVRGRTVDCEIVAESDPPGARCRVGTTDLAEWLVRQGWAEAIASGGLHDLMTQAQERKAGLWAD